MARNIKYYLIIIAKIKIEMALCDVDFEYSDKVCVVCGVDIETEHFVNVRAKGVEALIRRATVFNNVKLKNYLLSNENYIVKEHDRCRKMYTHSRVLETVAKQQSTADAIPTKRLRSCQSFNFREDCFLCGLSVDKKHSTQYPWSEVSTFEIDNTVRSLCHSRSCDQWTEKVHSRLQSCNDFRAEDAIYHKTVLFQFLVGS